VSVPEHTAAPVVRPGPRVDRQRLLRGYYFQVFASLNLFRRLGS